VAMGARVLSVFTGIGGIDLAFEKAGFEIVGQIEYDKFCNKVLAKHWPDVPRWGDILQVSSNELKNKLGNIDIMVGGFPCQDISIAGKKAGIQIGNQSGLWFEFRRLIGDIHPKIVFLENVAAINIRGGVRVIGDLAEMGYDCEWGTIRASDAGAPHKRERWFCIAKLSNDSSARIRLGQLSGNRQRWKSTSLRKQKMVRQKNRKIATERIKTSSQLVHSVYSRHNKSRKQYNPDSIRSSNKKRHNLRSKAIRSSKLVNSNSIRSQKQRQSTEYLSSEANYYQETDLTFYAAKREGKFESIICRVLDGLPARIHGHQWPARPEENQYIWEAPRVTSEKKPNRAARIKALGNAVVPQVIEPIAEEIMIRYF